MNDTSSAGSEFVSISISAPGVSLSGRFEKQKAQPLAAFIVECAEMLSQNAAKSVLLEPNKP
jgi:hypothetical protein